MKATFKQVRTGVYAPVNKRGQTVAKKLGHRSRIPEAELRASVGAGTYTFHVWDKGALRPF